MRVKIEKVTDGDGNPGLSADWESPEGPVTYYFASKLSPADYESNPALMDALKDAILGTYRRMSS
jgi:hypothetical protein